MTKNQLIVSKLLSGFSILESTSSTIKENTEKIASTIQEIKENDSHIIKLHELNSQYRTLFDSIQNGILSMTNSPEYKKFLEYEQQLKQIKIQEEKLDKEIDDEFSKISRPLGKYVYVTSLGKEHKSILEKLVERPSQMINVENKTPIITILESCMKGILSGTVSVKETDKSIDNMTRIISLVDDFASKKNKISSDVYDLRQKFLVFDSKQLSDLEKQLSKAKSDKEDTEFKIKKLTMESQQKMIQKKDLVEKLENLLENFAGVKYKIDLN